AARADDDTIVLIRAGCVAGWVSADEVADDSVAAARVEHDAIVFEAVDDETTHSGAATDYDETVCAARRVRAVQFDEENGVVADSLRVDGRARLRVAVNDDRLRDVGQRGGRADGVHARACDVEGDGLRAGAGVGVEGGLAE